MANTLSQDDMKENKAITDDLPKDLQDDGVESSALNPQTQANDSKSSLLDQGLKDTGTQQLNSSSEIQSSIRNTQVSAQLSTADSSKNKDAEMPKGIDIVKMLRDLSMIGNPPKDFNSYKFWQTQPVPHFGESSTKPDGEIKKIDTVKLSKEPRVLLDGLEWVTVDIESPAELAEVHELLNDHYVEDQRARFRLSYSASFLDWALKAPGWRKDWRVGIRDSNSSSREMIAFISATPVRLRVRQETLDMSEVNFLCVHKKFRSKRLAPILIEEITRRCALAGISQAVYTGGQILPAPVSSCVCFHRVIDWNKLSDSGFIGSSTNSSKEKQLARMFVPLSTSLEGFRPMEMKDIPAVHSLLTRYLKKFSLAPEFTEAEIAHWLFHDSTSSSEDQTVWGFVVEQNQEITDFTTFYRLDSSVIGSEHSNIKAAQLFYYASESAFLEVDNALKSRLNDLISDTLVMAKKLSFDVCNALTLLDNPLFLEQQKFCPGDGQLHYYLYNYRAAFIPGGINARYQVDEDRRGGVGIIML